MLAGTSCDAEVETEDLEDLEALQDEEDLEARGGKHDDKDDKDKCHKGEGKGNDKDKCDKHDDKHDDHHGDKCDPHKAPVVKGKEIEIWPPNHKMHEFDVEECIKVIKACDDWEAKLIKITSDEPFDDKGDGHHSPDIVCDEDSFKVRAERQGKKNGRVYNALIKVEHGHHKKAFVVCEIKVPHDQGKGHEAIEDDVVEKVWCSDHHHW